MKDNMEIHNEKIKVLTKWFGDAIETIDSFGKYDQLQILICAEAIALPHPNIDLVVERLVNDPPPDSFDYVYEYLEQLIFLKYDVAESKQLRYFKFWFEEGNFFKQNDLTQAYQMGYVLLEENKIASEKNREEAAKWLIENPDIPSMSFFAWTVFHLGKNGYTDEARKRAERLFGDRLDNGSWNNFPVQTVQICYPLTLSGIVTSQEMKSTTDYLMSQSWEEFSEEIYYKTGLLKWLKVIDQLDLQDASHLNKESNGEAIPVAIKQADPME